MKILKIFLLVGLLAATVMSSAQDEKSLSQLNEDEQMVVEAIALYPEEQRIAILKVSAHPEIPVRLDKLRERSTAEFTDAIAHLDESEQRMMYDVSRFPELIAEICATGKRRSDKDMEAIFAGGNYQETVKENASRLNRAYFTELSAVNELFNQSQMDFEELIRPYDPDIQQAAQSLVQLPEILTVLTENIGMTVLLGDIYQRDPEWLLSELETLNSVLAEERAKELQDWKESLENDTQAMNDFEAASKEFAEQEGYDETDYYNGNVDVNIIYVHDYWRPYPYWFGWPYWYSYSYWYPYPWWYHWGYYYGPDRSVVIIGLPSTVFVHWHFTHYHYFHHYPHFTNHYIRHYQHHPRSRSSVTSVVRKWEREVTPQLPRNWMADDQGRAERIAEYGRFRVDYANAVAGSGEKMPTQREFLAQRADQYPTMKPMLSQKQETPPARAGTPQPKEIRTQPAAKPAERNVPPVQAPKTDKKEINRGWDYHNNTWDRKKPAAPPARQQPAAPSRQKPAAPARKDAPVQQRAPVRQQPPAQQAPKKNPVQPPG